MLPALFFWASILLAAYNGATWFEWLVLFGLWIALGYLETLTERKGND